jgi:hypothetical protein
MSNTPVQENDMCFVIPDGGPSSVYISKRSDAPLDLPYTVPMTSGGEFVWECAFVADNDDHDYLKAIRISESIPAGFEKIASGMHNVKKYWSGWFPALNYPLSYTYGNRVYAIGSWTGWSRESASCNLISCYATPLFYTPDSAVYPCGCQRGYRYHFFDTANNRSHTFYPEGSGWYSPGTVIPGPSRQNATAVLCNGFVYLFGGGDVSFLDMYKYNPLIDFAPGTPAAYVFEGVIPYHVERAYGAAIGDKIYVFSGIDPIKTMIYDTVAKTWDTSVSDYFPAGTEELAYTSLYHKALGKILFLLMDDTTGLRTLLIVYFDPITKTFGELSHYPLSYEEVYPAVSYNDDNGNISIVTSDSRKAIEIKATEDNLIVEI